MKDTIIIGATTTFTVMLMLWSCFTNPLKIGVSIGVAYITYIIMSLFIGLIFMILTIGFFR